jgi:hemerythrin-like domain-containing protein
VIDDLRLRTKGVYARKGLNPMYVNQIVDFLETYADRCHQGKEENILFRALAVKGPNAALVKAMDDLEAQHQDTRATTRKLVAANAAYAAGVTGADEQVKTLLEQVADHYLSHVRQEDRDFYAPAMEYFTPNEGGEMLAEFRNHDRAMIHEKYRLMADALEADR